MKKISKLLLLLFIPVMMGIVSCGNSQNNANENATDSLAQIDEFKILADYLEKNGNYIDSKDIPSMVPANEVFDNKENEKYKIIDIRDVNAYNKGHILNAENVKAADLINYFANDIVPANFEKIVIVCFSGQSASFATSVLRLIGYNNVFAMKFGMSSWNPIFAKDIWEKNVSNEFADKLETTDNAMPAKGATPVIKTGKTEGKDILMLRAKEILEKPFKSFMTKPANVFANPANYFIVNYWPAKDYQAGHIPTSINYLPKKSLAYSQNLTTLPVEKEVVTYCYTGQHGAFVAAYLGILGYNAKILAYGANGFMHDKLVENGGDWHPWTKEKMNNYDFVIEDVPEVEENHGGASCG
jgi:rhodanese-related sulfurtransferase